MGLYDSFNKGVANEDVVSSDPERVLEFDDNILAWFDADTQLIWEIKSKETVQCMYFWDESEIKYTPNHQGSIHEDKVKDINSYIQNLNATAYAGYKDWRLPSFEELETLIGPPFETESGTYHIKKPLAKNTSPAYWTSTTNDDEGIASFEKSSTAAIIVDFTKPMLGKYDLSNNLWVRCVRGGRTSQKEDAKIISEITQGVTSRINSKKVAYQFVLEELYGANQGNEAAKQFTQNSGFIDSEYEEAMEYSFEEVDGPNGPQQFVTMSLSPYVSNMELMVNIRLGIIKNIIEEWELKTDTEIRAKHLQALLKNILENDSDVMPIITPNIPVPENASKKHIVHRRKNISSAKEILSTLAVITGDDDETIVRKSLQMCR